MRYQSTRNKSIAVESAYAIKNGISPEGGLYVPESIPQIDLNDIKNMAGMKYTERAAYVLGMFLTDYTADELKVCAQSAYSVPKFETEDTAPLYSIDEKTAVLELWHGPPVLLRIWLFRYFLIFLQMLSAKQAKATRL